MVYFWSSTPIGKIVKNVTRITTTMSQLLAIPTMNHLNGESPQQRVDYFLPQQWISYILSDNITSTRNYESTKCTLDSGSPKCTSYISRHLDRPTVRAVHHYGCTTTMNHYIAKSVMQNRHNTNNKKVGKIIAHRIFLTTAPQGMGVRPLDSSQPGESVSLVTKLLGGFLPFAIATELAIPIIQHHPLIRRC